MFDMSSVLSSLGYAATPLLVAAEESIADTDKNDETLTTSAKSALFSASSAASAPISASRSPSNSISNNSNNNEGSIARSAFSSSSAHFSSTPTSAYVPPSRLISSSVSASSAPSLPPPLSAAALNSALVAAGASAPLADSSAASSPYSSPRKNQGGEVESEKEPLLPSRRAPLSSPRDKHNVRSSPAHSEHSSGRSTPLFGSESSSSLPLGSSRILRFSAASRVQPPAMVAARLAEEEEIVAFEVFEEENSQPIESTRWHAWFCPEDKEFVVSAPSRIFEANKNGLVSLMEVAEELGCGEIWMAMDASRPDFSQIVASLSFLGFRRVPKMQSSAADNTVMLRYNIDA